MTRSDHVSQSIDRRIPNRAMMLRCLGFSVIVCLASLLQVGDGYRILCVFPSPSISHQVVFRGLTLALNKRGHELVVVTPDPINDPSITNYTEINTRFEYDTYSVVPFLAGRGETNWMGWTQIIGDRFTTLLDRILDHPDMRNLYAPDSGQKFDLLLVEMLYWPGIYSLASRFDVPIIGISSVGLSMHNQYGIGNPVLPSHLSNWELESRISERSSFWQRLGNFVTVWKYLYWSRTTFLPEQDAIARKYLGNDIPSATDLEKNISLIFVAQQGPISYMRPNIPKIIQIGGFHVSVQTTNLPEDLKKILDEATQGFVYMSLGSNVKSTSLPQETLEKLITAFSKLPYKVLWKFEDDVLPNKPKNVHIMKWVPQQAVLAHPNLKVFIYQGGLQSTEEAVSHAVPLIGLPVFADQDMQVNKMESLGVAKKLEIRAIDENELFEAISTVATDSNYKQKMMSLRSLIKDTPHDPLENAIWWTEHVIRHRGAPHLHSTAADEPWYSRQDMDIVASISAAFVILSGLTLIISYHLIKSIYRTYTARTIDTKKIR